MYCFLVLILVASILNCGNAAATGRDIDWNQMSGVWFMTISNNLTDWDFNVKCHIISPYNVEENKLQIFYYNLPRNSDDAPFTITEDVRVLEDQYRLHTHSKNAWDSNGLKYEETDLAKKKLKDDQHWYEEHPIFYSTDYKTYIYQKQVNSEGTWFAWFWTRNSKLSPSEYNIIRKIAESDGLSSEDLVKSGCGDINPREYFGK